MSDSVKLMKKWFDDIQADEILGGLSEQEMAYIIYAAAHYGFSSEKTNFETKFGPEFKNLAFAMSNIYGQIDNIQNYSDKMNTNVKYDAEQIYQLRMEGKTGKEICQILGLPPEKQRSLSTNPGWKRAKKDLDTQKNTETVQKNTDSVQTVTDSTDTDTAVQKSVNVVGGFNF